MKIFAYLTLPFLVLMLLSFSFETSSPDQKIPEINYSEADPAASSWELMRMDSVMTDFQDVLASYRGKVVYMDIWASWCGPCISAFKKSKSYRLGYEGEDVVFLYVSVDESLRSWERAAKKYGLVNNSYVIPELNNSGLLNQLLVTSIPRYVMYDKYGNLVKRHAPPIGSVASENLIQRFLKE